MKNTWSIILIFSFIFSTSFSQDRTMGLLINDSMSQNGYTLFSPIGYTNSYLIDNCGELINEWTFDHIPGMTGYLMDDGSLLRAGRVFNGFGTGGSGGLIQIRSWENELTWSFEYSTDSLKQHHDLSVLPNGNFLMIAWEKRSLEETLATGRISSSIPNNGVWFEQIIEIKPIGTDSAEIVWAWHLYDHLIQDVDPTDDNFGSISESPGRMNVNYQAFNTLMPGQPGASDWMHYNSVDHNPELDLILFSGRNSNEIYIIDHSTTTEEAAGRTGGRYGKGGDFLFRWGNPQVYNKGSEEDQVLFAQHDASWGFKEGKYTGKISIFNNGIGRENSISSIEIIEPELDQNGDFVLDPDGEFSLQSEPVSIFPTDEYNFSSPRISGAQLMDNGNTLICSGNRGTIFELDPKLNLVWQYIVPISSGGPLPQGIIAGENDIFRSVRYSPDYVGLEGRDLIALGPLELDPIDYECQIYSDMTSINNIHGNINVRAYPNPTNNIIYLELEDYLNVGYQLYDINGSILLNGQVSNGKIDITEFPSGFYVLSIKSQGQQEMIKIIKQ